MGDHIQVPMTHLHEIATKFASMKAELDGTEQSATELHGGRDGKGIEKDMAEYRRLLWCAGERGNRDALVLLSSRGKH